MAKPTSKRNQELAVARAAAMPEVKKLVKRFGRTTISWCIDQLHEYEKKVEQLAALKKEAQKLEKEIA